MILDKIISKYQLEESMKRKKYISITFILLFIYWLTWTNTNITTSRIEIKNKIKLL